MRSLVLVGPLAAVGLVAGCAAIFDIERAEAGPESNSSLDSEPSANDNTVEEEPARVVRSAAPEPAEVDEPSEPDEVPEPPPPTEEPERIEEEPAAPPEPVVGVPEGGEAPVPGAVVHLPPSVGLAGSAVYILTARGSTMEAVVTEAGLCIEGTSVLLNVPGSEEPDYISSWGTALKVYTNSWQPDGALVEGLSFDMVGETVPDMRFQVFSGTDAYCAPVAGGQATVQFGELQSECYNSVATNPFFEAPVLTAFEWQVFSATQGPKPFDFCIQNIQPIYAEAEAEPASETK